MVPRVTLYSALLWTLNLIITFKLFDKCGKCYFRKVRHFLQPSVMRDRCRNSWSNQTHVWTGDTTQSQDDFHTRRCNAPQSTRIETTLVGSRVSATRHTCDHSISLSKDENRARRSLPLRFGPGEQARWYFSDHTPRLRPVHELVTCFKTVNSNELIDYNNSFAFNVCPKEIVWTCVDLIVRLGRCIAKCIIIQIRRCCLIYFHRCMLHWRK